MVMKTAGFAEVITRDPTAQTHYPRKQSAIHSPNTIWQLHTHLHIERNERHTSTGINDPLLELELQQNLW